MQNGVPVSMQVRDMRDGFEPWLLLGVLEPMEIEDLIVMVTSE